MIVDEKRQNKLKDLLSSGMEQIDKIHRIIIEVDPSFERSKLKALLKGGKWPAAVYPHLILDDDESSQIERAEVVIEQMLGNSIIGKKFLDFGCGEGFVPHVASKSASMAVGYDIDEVKWERFRTTDSFMLTSDFQTAARQGPYDAILLFDVLDHVIDEDPVAILKDLREILKDDGTMYIRFHPWTSRHATHVYKTINKAYAHMLFSEDELREMGAMPLPCRKIIHPIITYEEWFTKAGLKPSRMPSFLAEKPEPFFEEEPIIRDAIMEHWKDSCEERLASGKVFPAFQMEKQFIDYKIQKIL